MVTVAPKNAVILAAGCGSRLRPLTELRPKPLVEVNGISILHNALCNLEAVGVNEVAIVVGYRKDAIQYACGSRFGEIKIRYVESTVFEGTGSAYSLWLAREALLCGDCFLLEGDVFFEEDALRYLVGCGGADVAAVVPFDDSMQGSAVLLSDSGFITGFRLHQSASNLVEHGPTLFKAMNLLRLSAPTLKNSIVPALDDIIVAGARQTYTEEFFGYLIEKRDLRLSAARCDGLSWYEIDNAEDLQIAERIFRGRTNARMSNLIKRR
ncbi:phosphocholine cytidylyltransferase family protein [Bradyrhizobium sp. CCGE-LA001]|uniref:phosphocholine cytidylyltransferase family protein n=1 Tax=Bradyrhizobium sp. CCGE-LA001 TaxID=1223566 RepID=UPI00030C1180|nr:phosphocholine cytidylyltransferase family protein [Bradyrhizobium sp. CCGE-LA001]AMA61554.1 hemolysin activation protein [Bradyrhizobium sp. CCGE-LA001]